MTQPLHAGFARELAPARCLSGRHISLDPVDPARHAGDLYEGTRGDAGDAVWTYLPYGPFASAGDLRSWQEGLAASTDPWFLTAVRREDGAAVGMVSFLNIAAEMRRLELGHIWYVPAAQRTRINTEASYLMLRHAFEHLGCRRVEWKCDALNERSRVAALRLGFRFEGIFRKHLIVKGRNRDTAWYAMVDDDWEAASRNLTRWLYENDDGSLSLTALQGPR